MNVVYRTDNIPPCYTVASAGAAADRAHACQVAAEGLVEEVERRLLTCAMPGTDVVKAYGQPLQVHNPTLTLLSAP